MSTRSMVVSIIGRPNVGKSTIFNRLMKKQHLAMTHDQPGVTRDRHYGIMTLEEAIDGEAYKEEVILVDTGGFYPDKIEIDPKKKNNIDPFFNIMADHAKLAIDESDLVLFVVDVREGLLPFDKGICDYIKSTRKPFWLIMNKFDTEKQEGDQYDFYNLGLDEENMMRVSAEHNRGFYDIRERLVKKALSFREKEVLSVASDYLQPGVKPRNDVVSSVAIIGAPNAGKSTLLNCLVGAQRALVSEIAGTTVDPIEGYIDLYFGPDVEMLSTRDNPFRKDNTEIFDELKRFQESGDVDLNISEDEEDLSEEEKKIYVEFGQTVESTFEDDASDEEVAASGDFSFDESNTGTDYYTEAEIVNEIEKNWNNPEEEVENLEHAKEVNRWRSIKIVDTAGIRKSKLVEGFIETQSVYRSLRSITESDVVLFMIDSTLGITHQDRRLIDIALEKGKSLIVCLNKIDLLKETFANEKKKKEWMQNLKDDVPWLGFCQLVTISAQKNRNINYLREALKRTIVIRNRKIPTGALNRCFLSLTEKNPVIVRKTNGVRFKVKYASMLKSSPPTFLLFSNKSQGIPENYRRYLINGLRNEFDLTNTPVHLIFRTSTDIERRMKKIEKKNAR
ncbi:ribosome biogenesis GTPase Der [Peredibacter starrii]|uniref:GTPase Der n=1 Tax=Peredibacter starrii TaxID=28202 RepID=A0AAX4HKU9_9BACT|nr:GTPase [Peredibacter starrii]WPU63788.1 GTPase [Peredibacter starrii]